MDRAALAGCGAVAVDGFIGVDAGML